jgi:formate hydrogenlyase subunit 4
LLALAIVCIPAGSASFASAWATLPFGTWGPDHPELPAAGAALFVVLLAESSRMPVDDPNTHLELTMVHEVMVLDHSGPDFAFILYGSAIKLFLFAGLLVHIVLPIPAVLGWASVGLFVAGLFAVAIAVGIVESITARLRLLRVPQFLIGASVIAALGLAVMLYRGMP